MFFFKTLISFLQDDEYRDLLITTIIIIIIGTIAYHYLEGWGLLDSLYFSVVTLTTIGFGDFTPKTDGGKIFTIFYIVMGIGMILSFINTVQHHFTIMRHQEKRDLVKQFKKTSDTLPDTKKDND
ncbi:potassium channel family protein [Flavobacterium sp. NRK F10]|uniref:Two pore domain potassium channel family protein n=1 Tax=Flavobacterium sediminis TaxID=2201181 RepID=A0A2U8QWK2_9FLAO|nr:MULTISPECIES: potassium channel family protein [Flavobacterium]AWM14513.1 two pore domain potassium channel family protein [Flavobacterium sediminis]MCO6175744.1 potassium channel family protein [Flavobacterium sp. NRK F10]